MLAVSPRLAPVDGTGVVIDSCAVKPRVLAVALHGELLEIRGKAFEVLLVGKHGHRLGAKEIIIPDAQETHQHRQVSLERRGTEVLVNFVETGEHVVEILRAYRNHGGKAD